MKTHSISLYISGVLVLALQLISFSSSLAQTRYKPVSKTTGGTTDYKSVKRDLGIYPLTDQGNAAFDAAINSATLPVVARPAAGAVVGNYSYQVSLPGSDYNGTPFSSTPAATLVDFPRQAPRPLGNYYPLEPQVAQNTLLLRRLPPFNVHASKIVVYSGPNFSDANDRNAVFSRGFNAVAESVPNRTSISGSRGVYNIGGKDYRDLANAKAATLPDTDPSKVWLQEYSNEGLRYFIDYEPAAKILGRLIWDAKKQIDWSDGNGAFGFDLDFEDLTTSTRSNNSQEAQLINMLGYVMQGIKEAAVADNAPVIPWQLPYDQSNLTQVYLRSLSQAQIGDNYTADTPGIPLYYSYSRIGSAYGGGSITAPMGSNTPFAQYAKNNKFAAGSAEYMRNTWDDQSFFKKDAQGQPIRRTPPVNVTGNTKDLFVLRDDARNTTVYGQNTTLLGLGQYNNREADNFIYYSYERVQQALTDQFFRAGGKHLCLSTDRQPGWENLKLEQWFRLDAEFKHDFQLPEPDQFGNHINPLTGQPYNTTELNRRPLNPDFVEGDVIAHYLLRDVLRCWGEYEVVLGQGVTSANPVYQPNKAKGSIETFSKALHRASQLNFLSDTPWRLVCPRFLVKNQNESEYPFDPNESYEKKPMVFGGIVPSYNSKTYMWMYWRYPIQDVDQSTTMLCWVEGSNGQRTDAFKMVFAGRKTGLDYWEVPTWVGSVDPKQVRFQFTDLTGEKQTWTGDYRESVLYSNHPTPPANASIGGDIYR
ncbi:hypothetical protein [Fibrella forsythiae]|uniref:T9SS C-terminal target domain-containing protein n=1 Tax=Fibrella forsythiae TaxID=2817061 RepID=A0ABS3JLJ1_9BACT|nr:hypothetical protein [Fibrella forsythiae]MBO0950872.1 hypothetical protein [Fibrella forsythiae]